MIIKNNRNSKSALEPGAVATVEFALFFIFFTAFCFLFRTIDIDRAVIKNGIKMCCSHWFLSLFLFKLNLNKEQM